jgi:hypothetical protein
MRADEEALARDWLEEQTGGWHERLVPASYVHLVCLLGTSGGCAYLEYLLSAF